MYKLVNICAQFIDENFLVIFALPPHTSYKRVLWFNFNERVLCLSMHLVKWDCMYCGETLICESALAPGGS